MMYLGAAAMPGSGVVADEITLYNSVGSSYSFNPSTVNGGCTSQNVESFAGTWYGAAGQDIEGEDGVAISSNSGATFDFINITELETDSRYGAYPTTSVWYISAGQWPDNGKAEPDVHYLNKRVSINTRTHKHTIHNKTTSAAPSDDGWAAQIVKTTDGGKTWSSVYYSTGQFYFNQIACGSASHCCAVGEADTSSAPGIRILCTWDAGTTWTTTLRMNDGDMSIMAIEFQSDQEAWAAGGNMQTFDGFFWHTLDGGKTWQADTVSGVYGTDITMPQTTHGYAVAFTFEDQSAFMTYQ